LVKKTDKFYFKDASVLWLENLGEVNSRFIDYAFKSDLIINQVMEGSMGATVGTLTISRAKEINIPLPPLSEQEEIVSILDNAFESIERAKSNAEQNLKNAKELFDSYLQGVFENKGEDWEEKSINEVANVINGYAFSSKDFKSTNKIKSIKITNVGVKKFIEETDNYLPEQFKESLKEVQVREGNILIALTRTIISSGLKVAIVPSSYNGALLNQRVAALVPNEKIISNRFLYNFLTTDGVSKYVLAHVNTLMQPNLSITDLKNLPVPIPSINEQDQIVIKLDMLRNEIEQLESLYQQKLNDLEELKKSILQKAFNGELKTSKISA
jgi:type I restriction enzyme S subunit